MAACNVYDFLLLCSRHDRFAVAAYEDDRDNEVVGQRSKVLKKDAFFVDWNTLRTLEYLERSKWGCLAILGSVATLPPSKLCHIGHMELHYALHNETRGRPQPTLQRGCKKVRNNHLLCQNKQMTTH